MTPACGSARRSEPGASLSLASLASVDLCWRPVRSSSIATGASRIIVSRVSSDGCVGFDAPELTTVASGIDSGGGVDLTDLSILVADSGCSALRGPGEIDGTAMPTCRTWPHCWQTLVSDASRS